MVAHYTVKRQRKLIKIRQYSRAVDLLCPIVRSVPLDLEN